MSVTKQLMDLPTHFPPVHISKVGKIIIRPIINADLINAVICHTAGPFKTNWQKSVESKTGTFKDETTRININLTVLSN